MRRNTLMGAALAVAIAAITTIAWPRASAELAGAGVDETFLLVVADVVDTDRATARLDELNRRFGELDGFHHDATDGYDVRAALVQTSNDATRLECPSAGALFKATIVSELTDIECPADAEQVDVLQPVQLAYVSRADFSSLVSPQRDRFIELLGPDLRFVPERSLIASGFRTKAGAEEFVAFARTLGVTDLVTIQVHKVAGGDIGLGQEPHPNGSGPLEGPLDDQEAFQR